MLPLSNPQIDIQERHGHTNIPGLRVNLYLSSFHHALFLQATMSIKQKKKTSTQAFQQPASVMVFAAKLVSSGEPRGANYMTQPHNMHKGSCQQVFRLDNSEANTTLCQEASLFGQGSVQHCGVHTHTPDRWFCPSEHCTGANSRTIQVKRTWSFCPLHKGERQHQQLQHVQPVL